MSTEVVTESDEAKRIWPQERILLTEDADFKVWLRRAFVLIGGIAALITLAELDRVLGSLPSTDGRTATVGSITGPFAFGNSDRWAVWQDNDEWATIRWGIVAYALVDLAFIAAYARALGSLVRRTPEPKLSSGRWIDRCFLGLVMLDVFESVLLYFCAVFDWDRSLLGALIAVVLPTVVLPTVVLPTVVLPTVAVLKWIALAALAALLTWGNGRVERGIVLRRIGWAVQVHGLAFAALLFLGALALVPSGSAVFDQIPDIQRSWFSNPISYVPVTIVFGILVVVATEFWMLGRRRSTRALRWLAEEPPGDYMPDYRWWIGVPVLVVCGVLLQGAAEGQLVFLMIAPGIAATIMCFLSFLRLSDDDSRLFRLHPQTWSVLGALAGLACTILALLIPDLGWKYLLGLVASAVLALALAMGAQTALKTEGKARKACGFSADEWAVGSIVAVVGLASAAVGVWAIERLVHARLALLPGANVIVAAALVTVAAVVIVWSLAIERHWREKEVRKQEKLREQEEPPDQIVPALRDHTGFALNSTASRTERVDRGIATTRIGDLIAVLVAVVGPLSLIRSSIGPSFAFFFYGDPPENPFTGVWMGLGFGVVGIIVVPLALGIIRLYDTHLLHDENDLFGRELFDPTHRSERSNWIWGLEVVFFLLGVGGVTLAVLWPEGVANGVGPIGMTVALLGCWSLILGAVIVSMQRRDPLALFWAMRLRSTPNLTLVVALMLATSAFVRDYELHAFHTMVVPSSGPVAPAPDHAADLWARVRLQTWVAAQADADCDSTGTNVRPLLLVVAEGGGGRAAYWTVSALGALADGKKSPRLCGAPFMASGVSGGSVGLVIDQSRWPSGIDGVPSSAKDAVTALTGPQPLARAITGLLGGDLLAGLTGIRFPTGEEPRSWVDRAGHLEAAWAEVTGGAHSPLNLPLEPIAPPGKPTLVLNSVDAVSGCRVLVAQAPFSAGETTSPAPDRRTLTASDCADTESSGPGSVTLDQLFPGCLADLRRSTAALLSARFPVVTPGGRRPAEGCGTHGGADVQLVDGGYSDGSGLATMAELAPSIVAEVAAHNDRALSCRPTSERRKRRAHATCQEFLIQPIVVYLKNSPGAGLADKETRLAAELLVPLQGLGARNIQLADSTWLQRLNQLVGQVCTGGRTAEACRHRLKHLEKVRTVVIAPLAKPAPPPPLGWTLSGMSRSAMDAALEEESTKCNRGRGWANLCDLRKELDGSP